MITIIIEFLYKVVSILLTLLNCYLVYLQIRKIKEYVKYPPPEEKHLKIPRREETQKKPAFILIILKRILGPLVSIVMSVALLACFVLFILPLFWRPSTYIVYNNGINESWFPQVLGDPNGVSWDPNYLLPSGKRALLITFNGYRELQEFVLIARPSSRQEGINIAKHLRLKGERAQLRLKIQSLQNSFAVDCRVGGSNNDSIEFGWSETKNLSPAFSQKLMLPPNPTDAFNAKELSNVILVLGLKVNYLESINFDQFMQQQTSNAIQNQNVLYQIVLEKIWFERVGNTLWWKLGVWLALLLISLLVAWKVFSYRKSSTKPNSF